MARHVFQYDRWQPSIGLFLADPTSLPPLIESDVRPALADEAGLQYRPEDVRDFSGRAARREDRNFSQQQQIPIYTSNLPNEAVAVISTNNSNNPYYNNNSGGMSYNADGTLVKN